MYNLKIKYLNKIIYLLKKKKYIFYIILLMIYPKLYIFLYNNIINNYSKG